MAYGVTDSGFVKKSEEVCFQELVDAARANISPDIDVSDNSPFGRLLAIGAAAQAEMWEVMEATYLAARETASGQALVDIAAITGTTPLEPSYSTVSQRVTFDQVVALTAGQLVFSVSGNPDATFANVSAYTSPGAGTFSIPFQATETGPIQAPSGSLTVLETTITGVVSGTNLVDADAGRGVESDSSLRQRRRAELAAQGGGTIDAIRADVDQVDDVESAAGYENLTDNTVGNLPPHSFEIVAFGGADDEIAQAIWDSHPAGIEIVGTASGTAVDTNGNEQTVPFSRPTEIRVYVSCTLTTNPLTYAGDAAVQSAIAGWTDGSYLLTLDDGSTLSGALGVGDDVVYSSLYAALFSVTGVLDVTSLTIGTSPGPVGTSNIAIGTREIVAYGGNIGVQTGDVVVTS